MTTPQTPLEVIQHLTALTVQLRDQVRAYGQAEREAVEKRHAADMAESRAFLAADGSMDLRRHTARLAADRQENDALVAEALVKILKARIRVIETEIDVSRTAGATLRSEFKTLGAMEG